MPHVTTTKDWTATGPPQALAPKVERALREVGLAVTSPPGALAVRFTGGSGCLTRLIGGWFVGLRTLPKQGTVTLEPAADGSVVKLHIEDTLGMGIMDGAFRKRFEQSFEEVTAAVERATSE